MATNKVNLQWISNDSTRQATFNKRLTSLKKKTSDLATLCGIKACVVVYGEGKSEPEVWPSVPEARMLLNRFNNMPDHLKSYKKTVNQEDFLRSRISHVRKQVNKSDYENSERETLFLLHKIMTGHHPGLVGLSNEDLTNLRCVVEMKMKNIKERFENLLIGEVQTLQEPPPLQQDSHTYSMMQNPMLTKEP